jgi:opacity protein-like surface antigen
MVMKAGGETWSDDFKMNPGFHVGPTVEFPISEVFSFETALLISTKGFKISDKETYQDDTYEYKSKCNLLYLDIPLTVKASVNVGEKTSIYGVFGPYLGVGLSGKTVSEDTYNGEKNTEEVDIKWGSDEESDFLNRLDYGVTFGAGVDYNSFQIGLSYGLGLANISAYTDDDVKIKNRVLGISVGYKFGGK